MTYWILPLIALGVAVFALVFVFVTDAYVVRLRKQRADYEIRHLYLDEEMLANRDRQKRSYLDKEQQHG